MNFYKKTVVFITCFFFGVSGVFLISGAGAPGLRLLVGAVCFISLLNLTVYLREFSRWSKKVLVSAGRELAAAGQSRQNKTAAEGQGGGGEKPAGDEPRRRADDETRK